MRFYVFFFLSNLGQVSFYLSFRHLHFKLVLVFSEKLRAGCLGKGFVTSVHRDVLLWMIGFMG